MLWILFVAFGILLVFKPEILPLEDDNSLNLAIRRGIGVGFIVLGFFLTLREIFG